MRFDLFPYPGKTDTGAAAADFVAPFAGSVRDKVFGAISSAPGGLINDEIADLLQIDRGTTQPRVTELKEMGKVRDSGQRRANARGRTQIVWKVGGGNE